MDVRNVKRRLKKWAPFKSIPEQWKMQQDLYEEDKKSNKPIMDEYELEQINQCILDCLEFSTPLALWFFRDGHKEKIGPVVVPKADPQTRIIKL